MDGVLPNFMLLTEKHNIRDLIHSRSELEKDVALYFTLRFRCCLCYRCL